MEQKQDFRRQVAIKLWISDLLNGQYIKEEGLRPNYVILKDGRKVSRINILGTVVSINTDTGYRNCYIDDSSGKLSVRSFEPNDALSKLEVGDMIFIVGRPREYGREIYVLPEIIKPVADKRWVEVRITELKKFKQDVVAEPVITPKEDVGVVEEYIDKDSSELLELIKSLDTGPGAIYEDVISKSKIQNPEKSLLNLMKNGEVFEVSPGKLKVLE